MRQLADDNGRETVLPHPFLFDLLDLCAEAVKRFFVEIELAWVCTALLHDGGGLEPDQPRPATRKAAIAPLGKRIWPSIRGAVAAFHGLDGDSICKPQWTR